MASCPECWRWDSHSVGCSRRAIRETPRGSRKPVQASPLPPRNHEEKQTAPLLVPGPPGPSALVRKTANARYQAAWRARQNPAQLKRETRQRVARVRARRRLAALEAHTEG